MTREKPTIMIIEDEPLLLRAIVKKMSVSGMDVMPCVSGQQALEHLQHDNTLPDAIWLDFYLKDMNGLAFMQELNQKPEWKAIPVIVVSNSADTANVDSMLAIGAKKYILKAQYRLDEIIVMVSDLINQHDSEAAADDTKTIA